MRSTFTKLCFLLLLVAGYAGAQQKINPTSQVNWPAITSSGSPSDTCDATHAGQPAVDTTGNVQYFCNGTSWVAIGSGGGGCSEGVCLQNHPASTQNVQQPTGTNLNVNNFEGVLNVDQYQTGGGNNGISNASGYCGPPSSTGFSACEMAVAHSYANTEVPQGWLSNAFLGSTVALKTPSGSVVRDTRNGANTYRCYNTLNAITGDATCQDFLQDNDLSPAMRGAVLNSLTPGNSAGIMNEYDTYDGGWDFLFEIYGMPQYMNQDQRNGLQLFQNNFTAGIDFGIYQQMTHRSLGDLFLWWAQAIVDGGDAAGNSEGGGIIDAQVREDSTVYAGTLAANVAVGATTVAVNCSQGCATEGALRLFVDKQAPITGLHFTAATGPQTTGNAGNSAIIPPSVSDSTKNFPVSTIVQLCYPGADNGASGAAGCADGAQPIGYVPSQGIRADITSGSITGGVATFSIVPSYVQDLPPRLTAGQQVWLFNFTGDAAVLNSQIVTVLSTGLSTTQFEASVTGVTTLASTGTGNTTLGDNGIQPAKSVTFNIVASYTGTGGNTNGLPAGFCSKSTAQVGTPGVSCGIPASGVVALTDGVEQETDSYTYDQTSQTVTVSNMQFPHLNGLVAAFGGLAGYAVEDKSSLYKGGGTTGDVDEVYPVAGSLNPTTFYYIPQRTNFQYGSPMLGGSTDGGSYNGNTTGGGGTLTALCFSTNMFGFSASGNTVTFSMVSPAGTSGNYSLYDNVPVNISGTGNASYEGTSLPLKYLGSNVFSYTLPSAPTGGAPTSGTVGYCNASYALMPAVRILSVYNHSTNKIDNNLTTMAVPVAMTNGDSVFSPHYQKMHLTGTHFTVTQFQPQEYYGGSSFDFNLNGRVMGPTPGVHINNNADATNYLHYGGAEQIPFTGLGIFGEWQDIIDASSPNGAVIHVQGCKSIIGCSSVNSGFAVLEMPDLTSQSPAPGINGVDVLMYYPNYKASTRSDGLWSGLWKFANDVSAYNIDVPSVGALELGHLIADQDLSSVTISANNIFTTPLTSIGNSPTVVCSGTCATSYQYYIVGKAEGGGTTTPIAVGLITNGSATLSSSNYNLICAFHNPGFASYDILKGDTSHSIVIGLSATVPNGASFGVQANYSCFKDTGGTVTPSYPTPTQNTTGGIVSSGPASVLDLTVTDLIGHDGCLKTVSGVVTPTNVDCGTGSGGNTTSTALTAGTLPVANGANSIVNSLFTDDGSSGAYAGVDGFTAAAFISTGAGAGLFDATEGTSLSPAVGHDILYADSTAHCMKYSANGGAFNCLGSGGSTSPGGSTGNLQYNNAGVFGGDTLTSDDGAGNLSMNQLTLATNLVLDGATSGSVTLHAQAVSGSPVIQMPTASGQMSITSAEVVTYSATPTFSATTSMSRMVLTGNVTTFTMAGAASGTYKQLCFQQGAGGYTVTAPSNVPYFQPIGNTSGSWYCQSLVYDAADSLWLNASLTPGTSSGLPTATAPGQAPLSTGAGTTYTAQQIIPFDATYTLWVQGALTISSQVGGSAYTGTATCTLTGGTLLSGSADTCTATQSGGAITFSLSGTGIYSTPPMLTFSGVTGGSGAQANVIVNPATSTTYARNESTGAVQYSNTDAAVVINSALSNMASTGGTLFFKNGTYNFNSATTETVTPYTTLHYSVGIPSANSGTVYPEINFVGEAGSVGSQSIPPSAGVVFNVTTAAETAAGSGLLAAVWMRPSTALNSHFGAALYWNDHISFEHISITFPTNTRGNEQAINALESSYLQTIDVSAGFVTTPTALGAAGLTAFVGPGTPADGTYERDTIALPGWQSGFEVNSDHNVLINTLAYENTTCYSYGGERSRNNSAIYHSGQWIHPQAYDCVNAIGTTSANIASGAQLDIFGLDLEYITTGVWAYASGFTTGVNLGGFLSWQNIQTFVGIGSLTTPFPSGNGALYTVESSGQLTANRGATGTPSLPNVAILNSNTNPGTVLTMLAGSTSVGNQVNFLQGVSTAANNSLYGNFHYTGNGSSTNFYNFSFQGVANASLQMYANGNNCIDQNSCSFPLDVNGTINTNAVLSAVIPGSSTTIPLNITQAGLSGGNQIALRIGKDGTTNNSWTPGFHYVSSGSNSNWESFGLNGASDAAMPLSIFGSGHVSFGNSTDSGSLLGIGSSSQAKFDSSGNATVANLTVNGTPTGPTAPSGTNTTQLATTAFVQTAITSGVPLSCQPGLGDGLNAIPAGTYLQTTCRNETGQTWTITAIRCVADAGSSTCNATNGAGTGLLTGAITGTSTYAGGTQSGTTTIASGDYLKVTFVADGTTKQIGIDVAGTY